MNLLKLNTKQSIFAVIFMLIVVVIVSYITPWNEIKMYYMPFVAAFSALIGSLIAKKVIKVPNQ
ncbi:hypothetical protein [Cytobacillus depressus]|uniref:hypothetical protein n=1 Tax=Cytobacillus depressus TaxID=1602942 RepID=UPI00124F07E9|nr:hypothetical protein [Cytobacillus depressus]